MKTIKIFLASSGELSKDREQIELFIARENDELEEKQIKFKLVIWERLLHSFGEKGIQDYFNEEMLKCDIVLALFYKKVGQFTKEEFELAYKNLKEGNKPQYLYVYFKGGDIPIDEVDEEILKINKLKKEIQKYKQIHGSYDSIDNLNFQLKRQLDLIIPGFQRTESPASKPADTPDISETTPEIPVTYRKWLSENCAYMDIDKLQEKSNVIQVRLPEIYIPLYANPPIKKQNDVGPVSQTGRNIKETSNGSERKEYIIDIEELIGKNESLLIEGHPGSGKTTLLRHLAYTLARGDSVKGLDNHLPVLIFLKDLNGFFDNKGDNREKPKAEDILSYYFECTGNVIGLDTVKGFCRAGKALFLLDGLDELKTEYRDIAVNSFANFRIKNEGNKVVFSGRPHGLEGAAIKRFGEGHVKIQSLNMEQIEEFIKKWFYYVYSEGASIGEKTAGGMISEIQEHPAVGMLTDNPLMLTAICILYHDGKELPGQRAELYRKFINNLLYRRFGNDFEKIHDFLKALAFKMHAEGVRGVDRSFATETLSQVYEKYDGEKVNAYRKRIEGLFDNIEPECGLLRFENGQYFFWHLTFQEFLTAVYIVDNNTDYEGAISNYWDNDGYKEVIELYIGYLSIQNKRWANRIVEDIVKTEEQAPFKRWLLVSKSMIDIHQDTREKNVLNKARERLSSIIKNDVGPRILVEAGETLGWLGDTRDLKEFIPVAGGKYKLSEGKANIKPFEMGKYPVTNKWFEEFIKAGGYKNKEYWNDGGKKWLDENKIEQPEYWNERKWKCPNAPVVGVSWNEAYAFTRWLTIELDDGYKYRLPDEDEWEAAASGHEGRKYPWDDKWDKNKCNNREIKINKTSPVGIFKKGNTPDGIADLSGNVLEWTGSYYDKDKDRYVLRGGSWNNGSGSCRCACRIRFNQASGYLNVGFRCARTLTL